jgi:hypothetical protein
MKYPANGKFPEHLEEYAKMVERGQRNYALWRAKQSRHGRRIPEERSRLSRWLRAILKRFLA